MHSADYSSVVLIQGTTWWEKQDQRWENLTIYCSTSFLLMLERVLIIIIMIIMMRIKKKNHVKHKYICIHQIAMFIHFICRCVQLKTLNSSVIVSKSEWVLNLYPVYKILSFAFCAPLYDAWMSKANCKKDTRVSKSMFFAVFKSD